MRKTKPVVWILGSWLLLLLGGCSGGILDPKGQIGVEAKNLILTATGLMLIVVIPVIIMTFYFAWKYRHNRPDADKDYEPNWAHSNKIEVVMWTIPIIIIAILATITWKTTHQLDPYRPIESDVKPITVEVVSMDWKWLFIYPDEGVAAVNEMAIPVGTPIHFKITSNSVMNSFFIPQLGSQIYSMAAMQTQLHLIADEAGVYDGISANYSGSGFSGMRFKVHALDEAGYQAWLNNARSQQNDLSLAAYKELSKPTENHPVTYFSTVDKGLFTYILNEFGSHFQHADSHDAHGEHGEHGGHDHSHAPHQHDEASTSAQGQ
jgi:cytochrome o ubiquinol oxidase subunit 2